MWHIDTWNVGSLTGRSAEIADTLARRRVDVSCFQETCWKSNKAHEIGHGYILFLDSGALNGRNGVGIAVKIELIPHVVEVNRVNDHLIWLKLVESMTKQLFTIISAYAPQVGLN